MEWCVGWSVQLVSSSVCDLLDRAVRNRFSMNLIQLLLSCVWQQRDKWISQQIHAVHRLLLVSRNKKLFYYLLDSRRRALFTVFPVCTCVNVRRGKNIRKVCFTTRKSTWYIDWINCLYRPSYCTTVFIRKYAVLCCTRQQRIFVGVSVGPRGKYFPKFLGHSITTRVYVVLPQLSMYLRGFTWTLIKNYRAREKANTV